MVGVLENTSYLPANVAVHQPCAGVVSLKSDDKPSRCRHVGGITPGWVEYIEFLVGVCAIPCAQDEEVVAVEMNGMVERDRGLHDDVDPLAHVRQVEDEVAAVGRCSVVHDDSDQCGVLVLGVESRAREVPLEEVLAVMTNSNIVGEALI